MISTAAEAKEATKWILKRARQIDPEAGWHCWFRARYDRRQNDAIYQAMAEWHANE